MIKRGDITYLRAEFTEKVGQFISENTMGSRWKCICTWHYVLYRGMPNEMEDELIRF